MNVATNGDIINKLQTDREFSAGFVVDNNYLALKNSLANEGIDVDTEEEAYNKLLELGEVDTARLNKVLDIPYNSQANNYTAGFEDYFIQRTPAEKVRTNRLIDFGSDEFDVPEGGENSGGGKFNWGALFGTLSNVIGGYLGSIGIGGGGQSGLSQEQLMLIQQQQEAEKRRNTMTIIIVVASIVVIGIFVAFMVKKK